MGAIYFHSVGNPYAGTYSDVGYFYHPSSPRSIPAGFKSMTAVDAQVYR